MTDKNKDLPKERPESVEQSGPDERVHYGVPNYNTAHYGPPRYGAQHYGAARYAAQRPGGSGRVYGAPGYGSAGYGGQNQFGPGFLGEISFQRLFRILRTQWYIVLLGILFALAVVALLVQRIEPVFQAVSQVTMTVRAPRYMEADAVIEDPSSFWKGAELINTRLERLKGSKAKAIAQEELEKLWKEDARRGAVPVIALASFDPMEDNFLVNISVYGTDPDVAAMSANAYAEAARVLSLRENAEESSSAVKWLEDKANLLSDRIAEAEKNIVAFRADNKVDVKMGEKATLSTSIEALGGELSDLERKMALQIETIKFLENVPSNIDALKKLPPNVPLIDQIRSEADHIRVKSDERESLRTRYRDKHPDMIKLSGELTDAEARLLQWLEQALSISRNDYILSSSQTDSLRALLKKKSTQLSELELSIVRSSADLTKLQLAREAEDTSYRGILARIQEASLSADANTATIKLSEPAFPPSSPMKPNKPRMFVMALFLGALAGFALAFLNDTVKDLFTTVPSFEFSTGVKVLAAIPKAPLKYTRRELARIAHTAPNSMLSESYAALRAYLHSPDRLDHSRVLLVTSTSPSEGKTVTAVNLAEVIAAGNRKTLLIDFDLRRPQLAKIFDVPDDAESLGHFLHDQSRNDFSSLIQPSDNSNLSIITTRASESFSPAKLMGARAVLALLDWAGKEYEQVIIDTPPHGAIADAASLATKASGIIIVLRASKTKVNNVCSAVAQLSDVGANVLGAVINDVSMKQIGYYGSSYYSYHSRADDPDDVAVS